MRLRGGGIARRWLAAVGVVGLAIGVSSAGPAETRDRGRVVFDAGHLAYGDVAPGDSSREVRVRASASEDAIGKAVWAVWEFQRFPGGMSVEASPKRVTISRRQDDVTFRLKIGDAVVGKYVGRVRFESACSVEPKELPVSIVVASRVVGPATDASGGVSANRGSVDWWAVVSGLWPYALLMVGGMIATALLLKRRVMAHGLLAGKERTGGLLLEAKPAGVRVMFMGSEAGEGELLRLGALRRSSCTVGSKRGETDVTIVGDESVEAAHFTVHVRGRHHWIAALHTVALVGRRVLKVGREVRVYDQDRVRIGGVDFTFVNPGTARRPRHRRL